MYAQNLNYFKELTMYILAGKKKLELVRSTELRDLQNKAQMTGKVVAGIALGLVLNRKLYILLITHYFGAAWQVPWGCLAVIVVVVLAAVVLAVYTPVRRILMQPITATISEL